MYTFSSNAAKPKLSLLIGHDLKNLRNSSIVEVYLQVKTILKALTGRPHEYTMEEALFILREEKLITEVEYGKLKPVLVGLVFYKYATHYDVDPSIDFITLEEILVNAATRSDTPVEVYAEMRKNPVNLPEQKTEHDLVRQHKKELYETEQALFKQMSSSMKSTINFPDVFTRVTGYSLEEVASIDRSSTKWEDMALEVHVKYQLVKGKDMDWMIEKYVQDHVPDKELRKVILDNSLYLDSISDLFYMKDIVLITLALAFVVISGRRLEKELDMLINLGYDPKHISFVREQIFERIPSL